MTVFFYYSVCESDNLYNVCETDCTEWAKSFHSLNKLLSVNALCITVFQHILYCCRQLIILC